jgi:hypothetical protein
VRFSFIAKQRGLWRTRQMYKTLGVSRGGFCEGMGRPEAPLSQASRKVEAHIRTSFEQSDQTYGGRRVWRDLAAWGPACGRHRVAQLMSREVVGRVPRKSYRGPKAGYAINARAEIEALRHGETPLAAVYRKRTQLRAVTGLTPPRELLSNPLLAAAIVPVGRAFLPIRFRQLARTADVSDKLHADP